jgi:hypothetical protein
MFILVNLCGQINELVLTITNFANYDISCAVNANSELIIDTNYEFTVNTNYELTVNTNYELTEHEL